MSVGTELGKGEMGSVETWIIALYRYFCGCGHHYH